MPLIMFAIKSRYLGYDNKWHRHTTKWHCDVDKAWDEEAKWEKTIKYLELANSVSHKPMR